MASKFNGRPRRFEIEKFYGVEYVPFICKLYHDEGMSALEISEKFLADCNVYINARSILRMVEKYSGKPTRTVKEAFNLAMKKGRVTWEHQRNYLKVKRKSLLPKIRYAVLHRDGFRCVTCGAGKEGVLEVDHVVSVANGGKNNLENLQTLCRECNVGKRWVLDQKNFGSKTGAI